jgi:hypothetical protein
VPRAAWPGTASTSAEAPKRRSAEARELLSSILGAFTERRKTSDLLAAQVLLDRA